jgi:hypothetical protein
MSEPPGTEVELSGPRAEEIARVIAAQSEQGFSARDVDAPVLNASLLRRLASVAAMERSRPWDRRLDAPWSQRPISGLVCGVHLPDSAYGARLRLAQIDRAARRSLALLDSLERRAPLADWPRPVHPTWGGLETAYARAGSLDLVLSAYGTLAAVATSQPVALAGWFTLTLDAFKLLGATAFWTVKQVSGHIGEPPLPLQGQHEGEVWEERTTKSLQPLLMAAVEAGHGLEYECGQIRIVVPLSN